MTRDPERIGRMLELLEERWRKGPVREDEWRYVRDE